MFDAVVGRLVLMYTADPVDALRRAAERVRSGGVICAHECDAGYRWVGGPATPLWEQVGEWFRTTLEKAGANLHLGTDLYTTFRSAGIPGPQLRMAATAIGGPDAPAWAWANVISGTLPLMERFGITTRDELDPPTLADRLLAETTSNDGCVIGPLMTGAHARLP